MYVTIEAPKQNSQTHAIMAVLEGEMNVGGPDDQYANASSAFWYNGRERGISLAIRVGFGTGWLVIVFGECRNSDQIFVDHWQQECDLNPPTVIDLTDEAYDRRKFFGYGRIGKAVSHIRELIRLYTVEVLAEKEAR